MDNFIRELKTSPIFNATLSSLELGVIITNPKEEANPVIYVNQSYSKITGYSFDEIVGKSPGRFQGDETDQEAINKINAALKNKESIRISILNYKKNGDTFWNGLTINPIFDEDKNLIYYLGFINDITNKIKIEKQLEIENKKVIEASKLKSIFLSNMSHEIRTPLNSIIGISDILYEELTDIEHKKYANTLKNASNNLLSIINDILDLSKIEAGHMKLVNENFNIREFISEIIDIFNIRILDKPVSLDYFIDENIPIYLIGDKNKLKQVLVNLIGNSIKFTEKGSVKLIVKGQPLEDKFKLEFSVSDTGIGIPKEKLQIIFDDFIQVDSSYTKQFQGTGLGLSITKKIIGLMNGNISAYSEINKGSTFNFEIEFDIGKDVAFIPQNKDIDIAENLKILLVDDSEDNRFLVHAYLKKYDLLIDDAENGELAIQKFNENSYDIILMDMQMPVMDGLTAVSKIREIEKVQLKKPICIIALTAYALNDDIKKMLDIGCTDYLSKPIKKQVLLETITKYTQNKKYEVYIDSDLEDLIPNYIQNRKKDITLLKASYLIGDYEKIKFIGHTLKGIGSSYGFDFITEKGQLLESEALSENKHTILDLIDDLDEYIENVAIKIVEN